MSKSLKKLIDINRLREFKNKLVGTDSAYVQTGAVDQTIAGTKTFSKPIAGSVTGSSGSCTGNAATATKAVSADSATNASHATSADKAIKAEQDGNGNNIVASYVAAGSEDSTTDIGAFMAARPSFIKSFVYNNVWTDAISMRHRNGSGDGSNYGTYIRSSNMTGASNLLWNHQFNGTWQGERTLIDSANLAGFIKSATTIYDLVPAGVIIPFAGTSVPTGYLLCNGAAVSRTNYANLFAAIGTRYGAGNGSTTFNLPDARDRVLQGASGTHSVGSYIGAGLPNITGGIGNGGGFYCYSGGSRAFFVTPSFIGSAHNTGSGENLYGGFEFNAQRFNALYGASNTVQSPAIATNFIIKY